MHPVSLAALVAAVSLALPGRAAAQACSLRDGPDIIAADLVGPANYTSSVGIEALALGTTSCNLGDVGIDWFASTNRHPVFGTNLYRYKDQGGWFAFEQVGQSWLLHGFFALDGSSCCTNCVPGSQDVLGPGCSDPSTANRAGSQHGLGPRWQIDAEQGAFPYPPANPSWSGSIARRLQVAIDDLEPTASSTTRYFGEGQIVAPDDAVAGNDANNASYRPVAAAFVIEDGEEKWTFQFDGPTVRERSALRAWKELDPAVEEIEIDVPGEGPGLLLAQRVTALGGGQWHYEYALHNQTSHESIRRFALAIADGVQVSGEGFHDVAYHSGDGEGSVNRSGVDWEVVHAGGTLAWQTATFADDPNANALRWGTTYNFRFDADAPPTRGELVLDRYRTPGDFAVVGVLVPGPLGVAFCDASDGSLASCPCANPGAADSGCDDAQGSGGVRIDVAAQTHAPDAATLSGSGFSPLGSPAAVVIRSSALDPARPVVFGDGLRCIASVPLVRLAATLASGGSSTHAFGHGAGAGTFHYQIWYRNMPSSFCDPLAAFNLSSGTSLIW